MELEDATASGGILKAFPRQERLWKHHWSAQLKFKGNRFFMTSDSEKRFYAGSTFLPLPLAELDQEPEGDLSQKVV